MWDLCLQELLRLGMCRVYVLSEVSGGLSILFCQNLRKISGFRSVICSSLLFTEISLFVPVWARATLRGFFNVALSLLFRFKDFNERKAAGATRTTEKLCPHPCSRGRMICMQLSTMQKSVETCGNVWKRVEKCGKVWKSVEKYGNVWKRMEKC